MSHLMLVSHIATKLKKRNKKKVLVQISAEQKEQKKIAFCDIQKMSGY